MMAIAFLPMDLLMDLCALVIVQLAFDRIHLRRLLLAELLLAACTLAALALGKPPPALELLVILVCAMVATGARRPLAIAEAAVCILCTFSAAAGIAALFPVPAPLLAPAGAILLLIILRRRRNVHLRWNIELMVEKDGTGDRFPALIDTGNRLREHRSGLPVLIVEQSAMPNLHALIEALGEAHTRTLPFGVLGGGGELRCFRPDRIEISAPGIRPRLAPDCWVAIYPGQIPGLTRALAPPAFAQAVELGGSLKSGMTQTARRFYHGVFKRKAIHLRAGRSDSQGLSLLHRRQ